MRDIRLIVCVNKTFSIGNGNDLLYHFKNDMKHFKELTENNIVVMGRKTYDSLPKKPLPNRINIILTSNKDYKSDGCIVKTSLNDILDLYDKEYPDKILYVIGGGEIYNLFINNNLVDAIEITFVNDDLDGCVKFPNIFTDSRWELVMKGDDVIDEKTKLKYYFSTFMRKNS